MLRDVIDKLSIVLILKRTKETLLLQSERRPEHDYEWISQIPKNELIVWLYEMEHEPDSAKKKEDLRLTEIVQKVLVEKK